ncbi:MAG: hypothetical protein K9H61_04995 [Bacteroidia bacterium]|nr:hypothetical protein [Bacteroidia bacterium]MCF8446335.1 hypothetical protein [Bacteroidia bacterium]
MRGIKTIIFSAYLFFLIDVVKGQSRSSVFIWRDFRDSVCLVNEFAGVDSMQCSFLNGKSPGIYIVYEGRNDMKAYSFPSYEGFGYDTLAIFEDPMDIITTRQDTCNPEKDTLPDGRWSKYLIYKNGICKRISIKTVENGLLNGMRKRYGTYENFSSLLIYEKGFMKLRLVMRDNQVIAMGTYRDCNKVVEEKVWADGQLYRLTKNNKLTGYNVKGRIEFEVETEDWGEPLKR